MLTKDQLQFILHITDWMHGHWEDPGWGRRPFNQLLIQLGVHTLASGIEDKEARAVIQKCLEKSMAGAAKQIASTPDPIPPAPR